MTNQINSCVIAYIKLDGVSRHEKIVQLYATGITVQALLLPISIFVVNTLNDKSWYDDEDLKLNDEVHNYVNYHVPVGLRENLDKNAMVAIGHIDGLHDSLPLEYDTPFVNQVYVKGKPYLKINVPLCSNRKERNKTFQYNFTRLIRSIFKDNVDKVQHMIWETNDVTHKISNEVVDDVKVKS